MMNRFLETYSLNYANLFFAFSLFLMTYSSISQEKITYTIKPIQANDRTNLEVTVKFITHKDSVHTIKLPTDNYGTPNIHKYITKFNSEKGAIITNGESSLYKKVIPNSNGVVNINYTVSYDPKKIEGSAFAPNINKDYFSLAGCQWMLHIGDDKQKRLFNISLVDAPKKWVLHSSIGTDATKLSINASYEDLISSRIGGGGLSHKFYVKNKPVTIIIKGGFDIPVEEIFNATEKIVRLQRDWFEDYNQSFYHVVINNRSNVIAGTAIKNQFVCFVSSTINKNELNIILAHEMFHNWLPRSIEIIHNDPYGETLYEWFTEGFTTYFAKKILVDAGLLSEMEFIKLVNEEIQNIGDNPIKSITSSELILNIKERNFSSYHKNLAYWRGALIALKWESELQDQNKNLSDYIRSLFKYTSQKNGKITEEEFFSFSKNFGIDAQKDFKKYIIDGEEILLTKLPQVIRNNYKLITTDFQNFEPGFDLIKTRKSKKVTGVNPNSKAWKAGLRDDMKYVRTRNSTRGKKGWSEERKMTVIVEIDNERKNIEFIPLNKSISIQQIVKK